MTSAGQKYLIVNADDFGQCRGINEGIIEAYEKGIVTSASLMVRWPAAADAAAYSKRNEKLSLGLHVDLGEWIYRDASWIPLYQVVPPDDIGRLGEEVRRQLEHFLELTGKPPTHIDSHQHVHLREPARTVLIERAGRLRLPLRHASRTIRYCGAFYGQTTEGRPLPDRISVEALIAILEGLPDGVTELACHPGKANALHTMYRDERLDELRALCDQRVRAAIKAGGIELRSFHDAFDGCVTAAEATMRN